MTYKRSKFIVESASRDGKYILLFSCMTRALIQVPQTLRPTLDKLLGGKILNESPSIARLKRILLECGFMIESDVDEIEDLRQTYRNISNRSDLILSLMPTLRCNMACPYCFEVPRSVEMDVSTANAIARFVDYQLADCDSLAVDWYGGEPLLCIDFIISLQKRLANIAARHNRPAKFSMTTNGYLLTPTVCDALIESGIESFQVTIDGPREVHDSRRFLHGKKPSFDVIVENLKHAVDRVDVNLRVNVDQTNANSVERLLDDLLNINLTAFHSVTFKAVLPAGGCDDRSLAYSIPEFAPWSARLVQRAIELGFSAYVEPDKVQEFCSVDLPQQWIIGPDRNIYKCADSFDQERDPVGQLSDDGSLCLKRDGVDFWLSKPIFDDPRCRKCVYLPQCMGGCALKKLVHRKDWCPEERYALPDYVRRLFEMRTRKSNSAIISPGIEGGAQPVS